MRSIFGTKKIQRRNRQEKEDTFKLKPEIQVEQQRKETQLNLSMRIFGWRNYGHFSMECGIVFAEHIDAAICLAPKGSYVSEISYKSICKIGEYFTFPLS